MTARHLPPRYLAYAGRCSVRCFSAAPAELRLAAGATGLSVVVYAQDRAQRI